jgi:hypothetical protein
VLFLAALLSVPSHNIFTANCLIEINERKPNLDTKMQAVFVDVDF